LNYISIEVLDFSKLGVCDMLTNLMLFLKDDSGATAIEYGLIAALVAVAAIGAMTAVGDGLVTIFTAVASELTIAASGG